MRILVDIGGTYVRFATEENGRPAQIQKYAAADFPTFDEALAAYLKESGGQNPSLCIATAAHKDEKKIWRFVNKNAWVMDEAKLGKVEIILNDFEAAVWGLIDQQGHKLLCKGSGKAGAPLCLIGPGTGLGLGYLVPLANGHHVQGTLGGHIAAAALNEEHTKVLRAVEKVKERAGICVYEDVVSGPGLLNLYRALCTLGEEKPAAEKPEEILSMSKSHAAKEALRLFHEFFGLFAATVTVAGNSFGGLYLTGGVLDHLVEKNRFDIAQFEKFFTSGFVPSVQEALAQTPIYHVSDPVLSLQGLIRAAHA